VSAQRTNLWQRGLLLAVVFLLLGAAAMLGTRWVTYHSDAYAAAAQHVSSMASLRSSIGMITDTRLSWFDHSSVEEIQINGRKGGSAEFTLIIEGSSGSVAVPVTLARDEHGWKVTSAQVQRLQ
jgi:hypothetical protein